MNLSILGNYRKYVVLTLAISLWASVGHTQVFPERLNTKESYRQIMNGSLSEAGALELAGEFREARLNLLADVIEAAAKMPGPIGETIREVLANEDLLINNQDRALGASADQIRKAIVPLFKNESSRTILVQLMTQKLQQISSYTENVFSQAGFVVYDEVVVGAGPHAAAYIQARLDVDPRIKILVIDQGTRPGGTFAKVGNAFYLNSTNRANSGFRAIPGLGDLNYVHDLIGIPDFSGNRWPVAGNLADVTTTGIFFSGATTLFGATVERLDPVSRTSAGMTVKLKNGKTVNISAARVVLATGLGMDKTSTVAGLDQIIKNQGAEKVFVGGLEYLQEQADSQKPYRDIVNKEIVIVGEGDTAKVIQELLTGLGPEKAYGVDGAQVGQPKKIYWVVSGKTFTDCASYIQTSRSRYSRIAQALNSGLIQVVPARLQAIQENVGLRSSSNLPKYQLTFGVPGGAPAQQQQARQAIAAINQANPAKFIFATGLEPQKISVPTLGRVVVVNEQIKARISTISQTEDVAIATRVYADTNIFQIGPANEYTGTLVSAAETAGVSANTVSLFANIERTKAFAKTSLGISVRGSSFSSFDSDLRVQMNRELGQANLTITPASEKVTVAEAVVGNQVQINRELRQVDPDVNLRLSLAEFLRGSVVYSFENVKTAVKVEFIVEKTAEGQNRVRLSLPGGGTTDNSLSRRLEGSSALLHSLLVQPLSEGEKLRVQVSIPSVGAKLDFAAASIVRKVR